jgi:hypothetical protein
MIVRFIIGGCFQPWSRPRASSLGLIPACFRSSLAGPYVARAPPPRVYIHLNRQFSLQQMCTTGNNMRDQFSNAQQVRKPAVVSKGGIVAAQSGKAAEVGAEVLAVGGDCVDAVVSTTFALGVLEPWMSSVGGGGAMVLYRARDDRYEADRLRYASARQSSSRGLPADGRRCGPTPGTPWLITSLSTRAAQTRNRLGTRPWRRTNDGDVTLPARLASW